MSRQLHKRAIHLVSSNSSTPEPSSTFRVGDIIPVSGIYRVLHLGHRISHDLTLIQNRPFPRCAECGEDVRFELLYPSADAAHDRDFHRGLVVYEIPHPDEPSHGRKIA